MTSATLNSSRLLLTVIAVAAAVVAGVPLLISGGWWALFLPLILLAAGVVLVLRTVMGLLSNVEAPSPTEAAALEARGVSDPEGELNDRIEAAAGREPGSRGRRIFTEEAGEDVEAGDAAAQQIANTPSAEPVEAVGPGS